MDGGARRDTGGRLPQERGSMAREHKQIFVKFIGEGDWEVAGFRFGPPDLRGDVDDQKAGCLAVGEQGLNRKGWLSRGRVRNRKRGGFNGCKVRIHLAAHVAHLLARVERLGAGR